MHMFFRNILYLFRGRWGTRVDIHGVGRLPLRVWPIDLDVLGHMNNGVYLSIMDLGRMDLLVRADAWKTLNSRGIYPIVASETITFRKSLQPWQKFILETRVVGYGVKAVFLEQRFVVDGEIFARGHISGRFLRKTGGVVTTAELAELLGVDTSAVMTEPWLTEWSDAIALPPTRAAAPSVWDDYAV
jgi:acyl-CoA thioesterase FadM